MISRSDDLRLTHLQQQADDDYTDSDDILCTKLQRNVKQIPWIKKAITEAIVIDRVTFFLRHGLLIANC
jgi:hypothetical protein